MLPQEETKNIKLDSFCRTLKSEVVNVFRRVETLAKFLTMNLKYDVHLI